MTLKLITPATGQCLALWEVKTALRLDQGDTSEDAKLWNMLQSATEEAEDLMQRAVLPRSGRLTLAGWRDEPRGLAGPDTGAWANARNWVLPTATGNDVITILFAGITSVDSIKYVDGATGSLTTLAPTEYAVDLGSDLVARVAPAYGKSWPSARSQLGAVQIDFTSGWANAAAVPGNVKQWILLRIGAYYENPAAWTLGQTIERNPHIDNLLNRYKLLTA